jgi:peptidoglycan/xylan/chitin deacetylase (PgdA/CDA1 family)
MRSLTLILCYHAVSDSWDDRLAVEPAKFGRQIKTILTRGYRPVTARESIVERGRLLHVTFDDAFWNVFKVLPILEQLAVPATVFACPYYADGGRALDVPELAESSRLDFEHGRTMNWDQLRELVDRGVEVGSHSLTHAHLTQLSSFELERELSESRHRLEDELGRSCRFLAYPYGEEDSRVKAAARTAGYEAAFALEARESPIDVYAVPRVAIWRNDGLVRMTLKTLPTARRSVRKVRAFSVTRLRLPLV